MRSLAVHEIVIPLVLAAGAFAAHASSNAPPPAAGIELRLPADIVYAREGRADSAVVFSHTTHAMFESNRCTGCHPAVFPMLKRGPLPAHAAMNAGHSCGTCHDGENAFGVADAAACGTCHTGQKTGRLATAESAGKDSAAVASAPAKPRLPKPHRYPASDASPGPVTFRHETHTGGAGGCAACHPKPFKMAAAPPLPDFGMHEAGACGACHDGTRTFGTEDPDACMRCHREGSAP